MNVTEEEKKEEIREESPEEEGSTAAEEEEKKEEIREESPEEEGSTAAEEEEKKEETAEEKEPVEEEKAGEGEEEKFGGGLPKPVDVGDELDVTIESVGAKGDGIAKKDGFVIFVAGVQKGDEVRIKITELKTSFAIGEKL